MEISDWQRSKLNDPHEAYTGKHIGHRGGCTPPKSGTAPLSTNNADGDVFSLTEANTKESHGKILEGLSESLGRGMYVEKQTRTWETL